MPRPKSWIAKIEQIQKALESDSPERLYGRRDVERLFNISESRALELMQVAGASTRAGVDGQVSHSNLLFYVRHSKEAQAALIEIERRKKLAAKLKEAEEELRLSSIRLGVTREDEWSRFSELPNVSVAQVLIQAAFTPGDPVDALDTLYRFCKAVGNDFDAFERMCQPEQAKPREQEVARTA